MKYLRIIILPLLFFLIFIPACHKAEEPNRHADKIKVTATTFPVYDFARNVGGDKIDIKMLLPPGADAHHFELRPEDIVRATKSDIFLFTNFELEQWAYKIISAADKNTNMLAIETGKGASLLPLNSRQTESAEPIELQEDAYHEPVNQYASQFDPHIWLDMDNAKKMVDTIADAFIKKDPRNSDYYLKNANDYKLKLTALDQRFQNELTGCKSKTILHAGHRAFAYLAARYNLQYIATYNVFADAEPSPEQIFFLIRQIKNEKTSFIFYEDMMNPRLAQTIAKETGAGLLKLNNGHDISRKNFKEGVTFISVMEKNLENLKKGLKCPQK